MPSSQGGSYSALPRCLPAAAEAGDSSGSPSGDHRPTVVSAATVKRALVPSTPATPPSSGRLTAGSGRFSSGLAGLQAVSTGGSSAAAAAVGGILPCSKDDDGSTAVSGNAPSGVTRVSAETAAEVAAILRDLPTQETNGMAEGPAGLEPEPSTKGSGGGTGAALSSTYLRSAKPSSDDTGNTGKLLPSPPRNEAESAAALAASAASEYETTHVHSVYSSIACHFSSTRHKPWPRVSLFLKSLPAWSLGLDIGCGNGKYIGVNKDVWMIGSDACRELLVCAQDRLQQQQQQIPVPIGLVHGGAKTTESAGGGPVPKRKKGGGGGKSKRKSDDVGGEKKTDNTDIKQEDGSNTRQQQQTGEPGGRGVEQTPAVGAAASEFVPDKQTSGSKRNKSPMSSPSPINPKHGREVERGIGRGGAGGEATIQADTLALPFRAGVADFAICIAVLHHLSTRERRVEGVAAVLECLRPGGGQALLYVWALEQEGSRRGWREGGDQDLLVPWVVKAGGGGGAAGKGNSRGGKGRGKGEGGESGGGGAGAGDVGDSDGKSSNTALDATYKRYYHLYAKGELEEDVAMAGGKVVESGYERDNWWVVCERAC